MTDVLTREATWVDVVRARAERFGPRVAHTYLEDGETLGPSLTFAELELEARRYAAALRSVTTPGDRVLLVFAPGVDFLVAFHACLFAGVVAVPTFPPEPRRLDKSLARLRAIVSDCQPALAVGHEIFAETITPVLAEHRTAWREWSALAGSAPATPHSAMPDDLAFLQYTSGSTGEPRGVMVTHANLVANSAYIAHVSGNDEHRVAVCWLPSYHDMGLIEGILQPIYGGYRCYAMSPLAFLEQPRRWMQAMSRFGGTNTGGPSFAYELCCKRTPPEIIATLDLSRWRVGYNGAEPIRLSTLERFYRLFAPCGLRRSALYPVYGLAELTLMASSSLPGDEPVALAVDRTALARGRVEPREGGTLLPSAGRVVSPFASAIIVEPETREPLAADRVGEIWMSGPSVAAGYFRRDEATRETFRAFTSDGRGPFLRTGDLGFLRGDRLYVVGRRKDLIIVRGENHYPHDIEWSVEAAHANVRPGCVAAVSIERDDEEALAIAAELKTRADDAAVEAAIRAAVSARHGLDIAELRLLDPGALPKTSSGKLQRSAARAFFVEQAAPRRSPEPVFTKPWQRAAHAFVMQRLRELHRAEPSLSQPPAALGLDSLEITSLKGELEDAFERRFDISALIDAPTLAAGIEAMLTLADRKQSASPTLRTDHASLNETAAFAWQTLHPTSDALLVTVEIALETAVDRHRLDEALRRLSARHEALRSRFVLTNGVLMRSAIEREDISAPIDISRGPPFSLEITNERTLRSSFHHAGLDLDAVGVFIAELDALYRDPACALPPAAQASEWAAVQTSAPTDRARWQRAFARPASPIAFPNVEDPRVAQRTLALDRVQALARELRVTPFAIVFSALAGALAQHGNRSGFWIGVSTSARPPRFRGSVASFTQIVPVYVPPNAHTHSFSSLTHALSQSLLESIDRDALPTRPVTELIPAALRRDIMRAVVHYRHLPLALDASWAPALLTQSSGTIDFFAGRATARAWLGRETQAPFELDVSAPSERDLELAARGTTGANTILLDAAFDLITGDPHRTVVDAIAAKARVHAPARTATTGFFTTIARHADAGRCALIYPDSRHDYAEIIDRARRFAALLHRHGVGPGSVIALYCEPTPQAAMALVGIWLRGATALLLDTSLPAARVGETVARAKPALCVYGIKHQSRLPRDFALPVIDVRDEATWQDLPIDAPVSAPNEHALCWCSPRATSALQTATYAQLFTAAAATSCTPEDCVALATLTSNPMWATDLAGALFVGARAYIAPVLDLDCPGWQAAHMRDEGVTLVRSSQFRLRLFLNNMVDPRATMPTVRRWSIDGGPLAASTLAKIERHLGVDRVRVVYSPPSVGREVAAGDFAGARHTGRLVEGTEIAIVDARGAALPFWTLGEIIACGRRTGDQGWLSPDGELFLHDRPARAETVRIRGELVSLRRAQTALAELPGVRAAGVLPFSDARGELQLCAYVVSDLDAASVLSAARTSLAPEEVPFTVERVTALRFSDDGILAEDVTQPRWARIGAAPAPRTASERAVAAMFERVLQTPARTIADDFFLLGGDSMLAVMLVEELSRAGVRLSLGELKETSTVTALAKKLDAVG